MWKDNTLQMAQSRQALLVNDELGTVNTARAFADPTAIEKVVALKALRDQMPGTDTATQANRLLHALRLFPVTTFEASRLLDIYHPPGRIRELRQRGYSIHTSRIYALTEAGVKHCIGRYVLFSKGAPD